ncbi:MAG: TraR/DksA C4-type zinc finger protein [Actinobacteria bacterium]|nr:TraR/DksA C4-type zinc finger protein [Actinomycetota bacterium]
MKKKSVPARSVAKKAPVKKAPAKSVSKKSVAKKAPARSVAKKAPAKKAPARSVAKKTLAKPAETKKAPGRPFPAKVSAPETNILPPTSFVAVPVVEERRLVMPPPPRPTKNGRKSPPLKPIKGAPLPVVVAENETPWSATELKAVRSALAKELVRLNTELASVELEMDALIRESGEGAGDDQADAGTKTFEREHEMSLVINARDMVLQTERALERIDNRTYGRCEECGNPIGKARLQVFPRATLCMTCKQKEERR